MPINKIQVLEYECLHCGHKWINRVNGKDGSTPKKCAKCKRMNWNGVAEGYDPIDPNERRLRVKLYKYEGSLKKFMGIEGTHYEPNKLCSTFLNLKPRPNIAELCQALYPLGLGYNSHKRIYDHFIPDPDPNRPHIEGRINLKKGTKYGTPLLKSEYVKTLINETNLRRQYMKKVIKSRGQKVPKEKTKNPLPAFFLTVWGYLFDPVFKNQ